MNGGCGFTDTPFHARDRDDHSFRLALPLAGPATGPNADALRQWPGNDRLLDQSRGHIALWCCRVDEPPAGLHIAYKDPAPNWKTEQDWADRDYGRVSLARLESRTGRLCSGRHADHTASI
jgi:hypothetical protein